MVAETDDKEERTEEDGEMPSADSALIGWLGAIHAEVRAMRVEMREEIHEVRRDLSERIDRVEQRMGERVGSLEERVTRIEAGIEAERASKNRTIMWLGIGIGALVGVGGVIVGVIGLLN